MSAVNNDYKLGALQTTEMYSLMVLKAGSLKSKCRQHHHTSSRASGKDLPMPLQASDGCSRSSTLLGMWLCHSSLCLAITGLLS